MNLEWHEIPGRQYVLQGSADLVNWTQVIAHPSTTATHPLLTGEPEFRYYRVSIRLIAP